MQQNTITIAIDGNSYTLNPADKDSIAGLPAGDRKQLITLLESIQLFEQQQHNAARQAQARANSAATLASTEPGKNHRLGAGDVDQLMAQLALEDKNQRKQGVTAQGLYKWMGICVAVIILLFLIF